MTKRVNTSIWLKKHSCEAFDAMKRSGNVDIGQDDFMTATQHLIWQAHQEHGIMIQMHLQLFFKKVLRRAKSLVTFGKVTDGDW